MSKSLSEKHRGSAFLEALAVLVIISLGTVLLSEHLHTIKELAKAINHARGFPALPHALSCIPQSSPPATHCSADIPIPFEQHPTTGAFYGKELW